MRKSELVKTACLGAVLPPCFPLFCFVFLKKPDNKPQCCETNGPDDENETHVFVFICFIDGRRPGKFVRPIHNNGCRRCRCRTWTDDLELFSGKLRTQMDIFERDRWVSMCLPNVQLLTAAGFRWVSRNQDAVLWNRGRVSQEHRCQISSERNTAALPTENTT